MRTKRRRRRKQDGIQRIIEKLRAGPLRFGELIKETRLSKRGLATNLNNLTRYGIIQQSEKRGPYSLRLDLLTEGDLVKLHAGEQISKLVGMIDVVGDYISKVHGSGRRRRALTLFFVQNLSLFAMYICSFLADLVLREKSEEGTKLVDKIAYTQLASWIGLLYALAIENRELVPRALIDAFGPFNTLASSSTNEFAKVLTHGSM